VIIRTGNHMERVSRIRLSANPAYMDSPQSTTRNWSGLKASGS